jgi:hypothetical protein
MATPLISGAYVSVTMQKSRRTGVSAPRRRTSDTASPAGPPRESVRSRAVVESGTASTTPSSRARPGNAA